MAIITIPYRPRKAFKPLHNRKERWALVVAHRRAGKTVACINELIKSALLAKLPNSRFAYVAPYYRQAKIVAWTYLKSFTDVIEDIRINESELYVEFPNGARISLYGADKPDTLRGIYLDGIVADEYGDWRPSVWGYVIRPALADRRGWAIVIGTPKGRNQFWELKEYAQRSKEWHVSIIKASESGILLPEEYANLKLELTEDAWRQEMECDFDAALPGAIYGRELWELEQNGRIKAGIYDPALKTHAAMDLGFSDDTAIWWFQVNNGKLAIVDCFSSHGKSISYYNDVLQAKPYHYGDWLWLPHDARAKSLQTGRSIEEQFRSYGWKTRIVPQLCLIDGIQASRLTLRDCYFDLRCKDGIEALKQYQREYDEDKKCFKDQPRHDWTSHYADAFRYSCLVWREEMQPKPPPEPKFPVQLTVNERLQRHFRTTRSEE